MRHFYVLLVGAALAAHAGQAQGVDFTPVSQCPIGPTSTPLSVAVGDVTGDGLPDQVVVLGSSNGQVAVLAGLGNGSFGAPTFYPTLPNPTAVQLGDLNADGRPDAVVAGATGVGVLLGLAGGQLGPVTIYPVTAPSNGNPHSLALADFTGDGRLDVGTVRLGTDRAFVLPGLGAGALGPATGYYISTGAAPEAVAVGDVTDDGRPDLVVALGGSYGQVAVLPGTAAGGLGPAQVLGSGGAAWVALGDVNRDGKPDIMTAVPNGGSFGTFLGQGGGVFGAFGAAPAYGTAQYGASPVLADLNGDAWLDLVVVLFGGNTVAVVPGSSGGFGAAVSFSAGPGSSPLSVAVADLNGDTRPDLVTANYDGHATGVLLNDQPALLLGNPSSGAAGGALTLRGGGLTGATAVVFAPAAGAATTVPAASFGATAYASLPHSISLTVPATLAAGPYEVRVSTPRGFTNALRFTVTAALAGFPSRLAEGLTLSPNPAHSAALLTVPAVPEATHADLTVVGALGQEVRRAHLLLPPGGLRHPLDVAGLPPGLYLVRVQAGPQQAVCRLLVD